MPNETALTKKITTYLKRHGWLVKKDHGHGMQQSGWPDLMAIKAGRVVFIEVKIPGNRPSKIQIYRIAEIRRAGIEVGVVYCVEDVIKFL